MLLDSQREQHLWFAAGASRSIIPVVLVVQGGHSRGFTTSQLKSLTSTKNSCAWPVQLAIRARMLMEMVTSGATIALKKWRHFPGAAATGGIPTTATSTTASKNTEQPHHQRKLWS
ncbi:hypothetical protein RHMOL_Rhmol12G0025200 [Rhododendron molle]|uniref:Uncharacterized protein n=1 Tax=Rhododendron molle TaxID=49168 RepID=A0ACC0LEL9_RHOML|nr:hypothetical protein RHMOL_Rhmol12G0025200 [Rhododendron molle]